MSSAPKAISKSPPGIDRATPTLWPRISSNAPARKMAYPASPYTAMNAGTSLSRSRTLPPAEQQAADSHGEHADPEGVVVPFLREPRQRREDRSTAGAGVLLSERYP